MKKIHQWKEKELEFLNINYNKLTTGDIAEQLGLSYDQVRSKIRFLGLDKDLKRRKKLKQIGGIRSQIKRKEDRKLSRE